MKSAVMLGILYILSVQPMMIISSLILIVLLYSMYMYWALSSFWFSYMMVLVLMSGVLVVFTYMMSVLPNESFELSGLVLLVFGIIVMHEGGVSMNYFHNMDMGSMMIWWGVGLAESMFLIIYLLFIMLMVVWLSMMERGTIRIS